MSSSIAPINYIASDSRITAFPIGRPELYELYEKMFNCLWSPSIIRLEDDVRHYDALTDAERQTIDYTLGFFATSDGLVNENLVGRFMGDIPIYEAGLFLRQQCSGEDVHAITYSKLIDKYIADPVRRASIFNSINTLPSVKRIADFIRATTASEAAFAERILRMICVEGVLFPQTFAEIFWFGKRGLLPGLAQSNQLISRDENLHTLFAIEIYNMLTPSAKLSRERVLEIFEEAIDIGNQFVREKCPEPLFDRVAGPLNADLLREYGEHQVNIILEKLGYATHYVATNPFPFMEMQNMANHGNFFERKITDYRQADEDLDEDEF